MTFTSTIRITGPVRTDRIDPREVLDAIHAAMSYPFEWSSDTPDAVAEILLDAGYVWPDEDKMRKFEDEDGRDITDPKIQKEIRKAQPGPGRYLTGRRRKP